MLPDTSNDVDPEFIAIVLAGSIGTRLYPFTNEHHPKHLLPIAGSPLLHRLLHTLGTGCGFQETIVVIAPDDVVTIPSIREQLPEFVPTSSTSCGTSTTTTSSATTTTHLASPTMRLTLLQPTASSCGPTAAFLAAWAERPTSHAVVLPGDLVVTDPSVLRAWIHAHRKSNWNVTKNNDGDTTKVLRTACTMLLTDCGTSDHVPLKESAKQKKGLYARDEEEREYIAIASTSTSSGEGSHNHRVVWKQSVLDITEDGVGGTDTTGW